MEAEVPPPPLEVQRPILRRALRWAALGLLALFLPAAIGRLRRMNKGALRALALVPVVTVLALAAAAVLNAAGLVLAVPIAISALLLIAFGTTLLRPPPMIERFARLAALCVDLDRLADAGAEHQQIHDRSGAGAHAVIADGDLGVEPGSLAREGG